jgi:sugar phosphate isomerase/epimerase
MTETTSKPRLGIQLYTVRELTDDRTFKATLTALADMGFRAVEFAWKFGGMQPDELAGFLRSIDLACCGIYVPFEQLLDPSHIVYDYAAACHSPYVTSGLAGRESEWDTLIPQVDEAGAIARSRGVQFTYHNHHQEFTPIGRCYALDLLRELTDPDLVQFELDLGWIRKAGVDPMDYWLAFRGRVPQIHLRDYDIRREQVCDIGAGFIDVAAVAAQAAQTGVRWLIYEQDRFPVSALESARHCLRACRAAGVID